MIYRVTVQRTVTDTTEIEVATTGDEAQAEKEALNTAESKASELEWELEDEQYEAIDIDTEEDIEEDEEEPEEEPEQEEIKGSEEEKR